MLAVGEHASFIAINRANWNTYSMLEFFQTFSTLGRSIFIFDREGKGRMEPELATLLTELVEKIGLLRRNMQHKGDLEKYEARMARIEQKLSALVKAVSGSAPALAKSLHAAWQLPARSLAFRNAEHKKTPGAS